MLSNLLKQTYVIHKSDDACIINSNVLYEERIRELQKAKQAAEAPRTFVPMGQGGFVEGLFGENISSQDMSVRDDAVDLHVKEPELPEDIQAVQEQMLSEAKQQAEAIVAEAREQADLILNDANEQAKQVFEAEKEAGYIAGRERLDCEMEEKRAILEGEMRQKEELLIQEYEKKTKELEKEIVQALIPVFNHVFHVQFDDKEDILIYLIYKTLMSVEDGKNFKIRVAMDKCRTVEEGIKPLCEQFGSSATFEVVGDGRLIGMDCRIESEFGTFDCGLDMELQNLYKDIKSLCM